jgi:hypothetical protein
MSKLINRIPLEDMKQLWAWGIWKEPMPQEFDCTVFVVCTSREACRHYFHKKTNDLWLLSEEDAGSDRPSDLGKNSVLLDDDLFSASHDSDIIDKRKFRPVSFSQLLEEVTVKKQSHSWHDLTVVVNPRHDRNGQIEADAMFSAQEFLATFSKRSASPIEP